MACLSNLAERVGVTENSESAWADAEKTRKGADQALDKLSSVCSSSQTATPWSALRKNYVYLSNALHFDSFLLSRLYEYSFISRHELDLLHSCKLSYEDKIHHLIVQLPSNSPEKFPEFCQILRRVGQSDVAERLEQHASQDKSKLLRSSSSHHRKKSLKRLLEAKVARLEKEKAAAVREAEEERQIAFAAAEQVLDKTVRAPSFRALDSNVKTRDDDIESLAKNIEEEFARLTKDSLAECSDIWNNTPNASNIAGKQQTSGNSMPRTEWHFPTPCTSWLYGKLGSVEDRLVVLANGIDQLYVQNDNSDEWNIFAREDSVIKHVVSTLDLCLVYLYDTIKRQYVIEQFNIREDENWRFVTVLPSDLHLDGVSVSLRENSLYVVGGETRSGTYVSTASVCDLNSGQWCKMNDMQTKRSNCSCAIVNNTLFVCGGFTDGYVASNVVECADVRVEKWRQALPTKAYFTTLTAVNDKLVMAGGLSQQNRFSPSDIVELYDERSVKWLPLPHMKHKRWLHSALSMQKEELIVAGGQDQDGKPLTSIETLYCF